ncbi:MAG: polyprenyl synthetase family protein [Prevotellaceae bacterium]|jgi:geranylgeranyl diphosphate synthase type II|nr:polyprenyl synthetase family protein [Prevotellaceae bacterium]
MYTTKEIQDIVNQKFSEINWAVEPLGLYAPIGYVLALGGKRLRPVLVLMAANLFAENLKPAINPAIGLEIFHNFTLLHDDIMDKAPVRRKQPTVHVKWNESTAILSGDAMLIKAYQYIAELLPDKLAAGLELFSHTALEVCEGQQYDMDFEQRSDVSINEYLEMIRLKTAVLLGAAVRLGALIGGADEENAKRLYNFGVNLGLAFQLKDDLLDVYGNAETFGKQTGGDILCNKKTFLLITALKNATPAQQKEFEYWLSPEGGKEPEKKIKAVTELYNQTNAKTACEAKMDEYFQLAIRKLAEVDLPNERKRNLFDLAEKLSYREV